MTIHIRNRVRDPLNVELDLQKQLDEDPSSFLFCGFLEEGEPPEDVIRRTLPFARPESSGSLPDAVDDKPSSPRPHFGPQQITRS